MSLSTCECGGHIPLGPYATNRCEKCGASVFESPVTAMAALEIQRLPVVNAALRTRVAELEVERDRYRKALEHIVRHLEMVAGGMAPVSGVYVIATKALTP